MGQQEKAREIVNGQFQIRQVTARTSAEVMRVVQESAAQCGGGLAPKISVGEPEFDDEMGAVWCQMFGPGRVVKIMTFQVAVLPQGPTSRLVTLDVRDFLFQKGSLGLKPTINGGGTMKKFVNLLQAGI